MLRTFFIKSFGKNSSIVANYRIFWNDLYMHWVMLNINVSYSYLDDKPWIMGNVKLSHRYGIGWKLCLRRIFLGSQRKNMSSIYFDIFVVEMTYHVCYGNSQSIGIVAGGELWKSQLDYNWIIECKLMKLPVKFG